MMAPTSGGIGARMGFHDGPNVAMLFASAGSALLGHCIVIQHISSNIRGSPALAVEIEHSHVDHEAAQIARVIRDHGLTHPATATSMA
jgi:hypothetical protein